MLDPEIKQRLDFRLASGEITREDYDRLVEKLSLSIELVAGAVAQSATLPEATPKKKRAARIITATLLLAASSAYVVYSEVYSIPSSQQSIDTQPPSSNSSDKMVRIEGGAFQMGCVPGDTQCDEDEKPRHAERVDSFYADVHEVTNAEYRECVSSGSCTTIDEADCVKWNGKEWAKGGSLDAAFKGADQPVVCVTWIQANDYCASQGKWLPTELEFEYALRGGREDNRFPWGDSNNPPSGFGNYADETGAKKNNWPRNASNIFMRFDDGYGMTARACRFSKNPYGLCDISGNVWEWTSDVYSTNYSSGRFTDRRVLRGGSWIDNPKGVRASDRTGYSPLTMTTTLGFRCFRAVN